MGLGLLVQDMPVSLPQPAQAARWTPCPQEHPRSDATSISFAQSLKSLSDWTASPREGWKRPSLSCGGGIRGWETNKAASHHVKPPQALVPLPAVQGRCRLTALPRHCHRFFLCSIRGAGRDLGEFALKMVTLAFASC